MRTALQHLARDAHWCARIVARLLRRAARIRRNAARFLRFFGMARLVPILRPLPGVADHVEEAVAIRRKRTDRRGALVAVLDEILVRKPALPEIRERLAGWHQDVAPGVVRILETAARGELPFGFGPQA